MALWLLALAGAYLVGSVPLGYLIARAGGIDDIRKHGSGNIGATNVMRTLGPVPAVLVLVLDALKGVLGVLALRWLGAGPEWHVLGGLAAMAGHNWPITLRFRGGKGAATGLGVLLALDPLAAGGGVAVFLLAVALTRYVSLGSMLGAVIAAVILGLRSQNLVIALLGVGCAGVIVVRHGANIKRLLAGTEAKFGQKGAATQDKPPRRAQGG